MKVELEHLVACVTMLSYTLRRERLARMYAPEVGDLVVMNCVKPNEPIEHRVGKLVAVERRRVDHDAPPDEKWDETAEGRSCPTEPVYVLELTNGRTFRWWNVQPLAVPTHEHGIHRIASMDGPSRPATEIEAARSYWRGPDAT